jgi:UDP-N-acetylmuramoyl-tripeptide--D-alanyl-D-alanine ligase
MLEFLILAGLFWIPALFSILKNILWDVYFWQVKEYRWDRFWVHIRWDFEESNRNIVLTGLKFILFSTISLIFKAPLVSLLGVLGIYIIWSNEFFITLGKVFNKELVRPKLKNVRNLLILSLLSLTLALLITYITLPFAAFDRDSTKFTQNNFNEVIDNGFTDPSDFELGDVYIYLALSALLGILLDLGTPLLTTFFVGLTYPIAKFRRFLIIRKAKNIIKKHPGFSVVAITGSYGKTTTKEILNHLLKDSYNVAKTPENYNTDVGVAKSIIQNLKKDTQIFIAEMGALRKSEIKNICKFLPPNISIVTAVDTQHIGIFGSQKKLFEAKSEIVKYMKEDGLAVINGDNEQALKMTEVHSGETTVFTTKTSVATELLKRKEPNLKVVYAKKTTDKDNFVTLDLSVNDEKTSTIKFSAQYKHLAELYLASICAALELNIPIEKIAKRLEKMNIKLPRLSILKGDSDTQIIDDTYSSNPKGFQAAVEVMNEISGKRRIVVTKGILELGKHKQDIYEDLIKDIRDKIDILITSDFLLAKEALKGNTKLQILKVKPKEILYTLRTVMQPEDVILLEGRLPPEVLESLRSQE